MKFKIGDRVKVVTSSSEWKNETGVVLDFITNPVLVFLVQIDGSKTLLTLAESELVLAEDKKDYFMEALI
ncbi:MAG: hypothetical protein M0R80_01015 [Proteobacteria bacterium]|jgi:hypothetical protein|nr:hypothetical protein [Pseudomonadota bacterium]